MIAGLYLGYDTPSNLGGYAQGGVIAAPIFKQFALKAFDGMEKIPFTAPAGIRMVRIDRASGKRVTGGWPSSDPLSPIIWEAFKPQSDLRRDRKEDQQEAPKTEERKVEHHEESGDQEFREREGGIY
jgi:penicillin-binding protein 1A